MKASIVDLRYKMSDVLKALERNEKVTILYRGKVKGVITRCGPSTGSRVAEHPFFSMVNREDSVEEQMDSLRGGRCLDL